MRHVEQGARRISLHAHVLGLCKACEGLQGARASNLCLVVFVCGQVGDASDGVALDLDVGRVHLLDQGRQAAESDNGDLVLSCEQSVRACEGCGVAPTVDCEVAQGGTRGSLHLDVGVLEQEQDGLERVPVDFSDICITWC